MAETGLFTELRRRNVFRVGIAYLILGWVVLQVTDVIVPILELPDWVARLVLFALAIGLPLVLFFAWAFELTPDGVKREKEIDRSQSITGQTGRKLDRAIIGILAVAVALLMFDRFREDSSTHSGVPEGASALKHTQTTPAAEAAADHAPGPEKSIAVLPFTAMSSGADDGYFADGLTEEILNSLAQLPELLVTARTSAFSFKGQDRPVQEIADILGVRHIVEGSVRKSGERLRVTAQLVRASDGFHLWSENYDSSEADTIAVQEDIAEKIATALDVVLDEHKRKMMREAGLRDVEAFVAYQKGLEFYARAHGEMDTREGLQRANGYFEQVIGQVPDFPLAHLNHSDLYIHLLQDYANGAAEHSLTRVEAEHALDTAARNLAAAVEYARSPEERRLFGLDLAFISGNWPGLGARVDQVLPERVCGSANWLAPVVAVFGYAGRAIPNLVHDRVCDPLSFMNWFAETRIKMWAGDGEGAVETARAGLGRARSTWLQVALIRALVATGQFEEAESAINTSLQDEDFIEFSRILLSAARGDRDRVERLIDTFEKQGHAEAFWGLMFHSWAGHRERANTLAASVDGRVYGPQSLVLTAYWCACGTPWDLEATPRLREKLATADLAWPPASPIHFPLKDW